MSTTSSNFQYQVGGSLPIDNTAYVERQCDRELLDRLKNSEYCFVFNSRQMGKSSLRVRTMQRLQQEGFVCAVIDPQTRGTTLREDQWYAGTIKRLIGDLHLEAAIDFPKWWKELDAQSISVVERFDYFIEQVLLPNIPNKIAIFIEEVDNLLSLKFDTDGFFILIRSLYERRAEKPEYNRLSFAFLGVATPADLIRGKGSSAFNIGHAVEMSGFTLLEASPLVQGLVGKFSDPQAILPAILYWTGGQPFLTQKLLNLVASVSPLDLSPEDFVRMVVSERVIDNWEAQDIPPHLKTIRDRFLQSDEKGRGRLLGLYQQVLDSDGIPADESYDQMQLRLTGLVVKRDSKLTVYNPIYAAVFNLAWVRRALRDLRPSLYAEAFRAWQECDERQKPSFLLRGQALTDVESWAKGKRLSDEDDQFLAASRDAEKLESNLKLENVERERLNAIRQQRIAEEEAQILGEAKQKADRQVRIGSIVLGVALLLAAAAGVWATKSISDAKEVSVVADKNAGLIIDNAVKKVEDLFQKNYQLDALTESIETMDLMKNLGKTNDKDAIERLYKVISNIQERNRLQGHKNQIWGLSVSPDGQRIISSSLDGTIKLWNVEGRLLDSKDQKYRQWSVKFSHNGQLIASVDDTNSISLWKIQNDKLQLTASNIVKDLKINKQANTRDKQIYNLAFSPNDQMIAFSTYDENLRVWEKGSKARQVSCNNSNKDNSIYTVNFHPQKNIVAFACNDLVYIWDINRSDFPQLISNSKHGNPINVVKFSIDGDILASASNDGKIKIWDTKDNYKQIGEIRPQFPLMYLTDIAFDNQNSFISSSHTDNTIGIKIWSLKKVLKLYPQPLQRSEEHNLIGHTQPVNKIIFNPSNPISIISASNDASIRLWSLKQSSINETEKSMSELISHSCSLVKNYINTDKANTKKQTINKTCSVS